MASPPITKSRSLRRAITDMWPGAVAGGEGEADRAVAEEVEGAAEAGVGVDPAAVEVDRAVVEGVVEVGAAVAVQGRARAGRRRLPLGLADDEGRLAGTRRSPRCGRCACGSSPRSGPRRRRGPRSRSCAGTSSPAAQARLAEAVGRRAPKFSLPSVAIEGCRPVSTRIAPALGWRIRKAGQGTVVARLAAEQRAQQLQGEEAPARAAPSSSAGQVDVAGDHRLDRDRGARASRRRAARAAAWPPRGPSSPGHITRRGPAIGCRTSMAESSHSQRLQGRSA